jgi:transglutaminase-like putative cysteine protease
MRLIDRTALSLAALALFLSQGASGQTVQTPFPNAEAVYTRLACEVTIRNDRGKLTARSSYSEDMLLATDKGVKMMGHGSIYHSSFNELKDWDAYTRTGENKKLKVSHVNTGSSRQDYVFYDDAKETSFDFTGVTPGATRHIEYELFHSDPHLLSPFYFDRYFPVREGELKVVFPSDVQIKYLVKGANAGRVHVEETRRKDKTTYTFSLHDGQSVPGYDNAPGSPYFATHVIFYIDKVEEDGAWKPFLSTPDDLYRYNYGFLKGLNTEIGPDLAHLTDSLTQGVTTDLEKAKRIYQWVQASIKYVAFEEGLEGFVPRQASLVCTRRFGDCKDMASILTAMLTRASVKAYYTWIGTRHLPYRYSETPLPIVDNHMICTVLIDGRYIFLDGTDSDCVFGMPATHIQGKEALVALGENQYKIVTVDVVPKEANTYRDTTYLELTDKGLVGKIKVFITGYYSSDIYGLLNYKNEKERDEDFRARFARGSNKIRFTDWAVQQAPDRNSTWVTANFSLPDYARKLGDEWILNLNLFKLFEGQAIEVDKRKSPVEYRYLTARNFTSVLKLPAGYQVSSMPKGERFANATWGFDLQYRQEKDAIVLSQQIDTDHLLLEQSQFAAWNDALARLLSHYKQTIVLSKK